MRTGENIYKRKDGRWEARYHKGRDPSGRIIYGFCYARTYSEAKMKVQEKIQSRILHGPAQELTAHTMEEFCTDWLSLNQFRLKESTYVKYQSVIRKYLVPYLGSRKLQELNTDKTNEFAGILLQEHGLAPKTVKDILLVYHSVVCYAAKREPEHSLPLEIVYPRSSRWEMRVLSVAEQEKLTAYLLTDLTPCKFGILLALWTGIRIGELCALKWDHVRLEERIIQIDATMQRLRDTSPNAVSKTKILIDAPKSISAVRSIPLNAQTLALCRKMTPGQSNAYLLTGTEKYMEPRVLQYHFQNCTEACAMEGVHFHTLRHTFATRCVEVGFDIKSLSEILGHANTSITLNRYVHCSMDLKRDNMRKLESIGM